MGEWGKRSWLFLLTLTFRMCLQIIYFTLFSLNKKTHTNARPVRLCVFDPEAAAWSVLTAAHPGVSPTLRRGPLSCCWGVCVLVIHHSLTRTSSFEPFKGTRCDRDLGRPVESFHFMKITDKQQTQLQLLRLPSPSSASTPRLGSKVVQ